jgi:hypothetical protein
LPRDSNGNVTLNRNRAVNGQTAMGEQVNVPFDDTQSIFNLVLWRDGLSPMTGNLNMNGFKLTGTAEGTAGGDTVTLDQLNAAIDALTPKTVATGTLQAFRRKTAPAGWLIEDGKTIGGAASGATGRANADTQDLFTLLWTEFTNTELVIQTNAGFASTRGASAAADFAANKRMPLFDSRTRFLRGSDGGLAFDATLIPGVSQDDGIKNHTHTTNPHNHTTPKSTVGGDPDNDGFQFGPRTGNNLGTSSVTVMVNNNTGGLTLETRPRSSVVLYCIKL